MKAQLMKLVLPAFLAVLLIGMSSCKDDMGPVDTDWKPAMGEYSSSDFILDGDINSAFEMQDGTLDQEFALGFKPGDDRRPDDRRRDGRMKNDRASSQRVFLGRILRYLELTEDQRASLNEYMLEYRDCMKEIMEASYEERMEIIAAANEERAAIIEAIRNGEYTREEAREVLQQLNERVRTQLRELVDVNAHCRCLNQLLTSIQGILEGDQIATFERWIATLSGPCFETEE